MTMISREILQDCWLTDKIDEYEPCYLFSRSVFEYNMHRLKRAYKVNGIDVTIGYSYKTNPSDCIISLAKRFAKAEVVSPYELEMAVANGVEYKDIIYNGVIPDTVGKFKVASNGGIVNVDNEKEFCDLAEYAEKKKVKIEVGIRINVYLGRISRFGVVKGSEEWNRIFSRAEDSRYIKICGIHCHTYGCRDAESWKKKVKFACEIAKELNVKYIDFGSNMYGNMDERLKKQFGEHIPDFEDYAEIVSTGIKEVYMDSTFPKIIIEPGTPVVSDAVVILAKVVNIRTIRGKVMATVDCSKYDMGFLPLTKNVPFDVITCSRGKVYSDIDIYGYTCAEGDVVHRGYTGELAVGDYLVFKNLGAYSNNISCPFIMPPFEIYEI